MKWLAIALANHCVGLESSWVAVVQEIENPGPPGNHLAHTDPEHDVSGVLPTDQIAPDPLAGSGR